VADETKKLAQFAASLYYEDIPEPVTAVTKACLTDTVAVCLFGSNLPWSKSVENFAARSETDSNLYQAARRATPRARRRRILTNRQGT
jgi:2-methylcitrate dehydratase PrpD